MDGHETMKRHKNKAVRFLERGWHGRTHGFV